MEGRHVNDAVRRLLRVIFEKLNKLVLEGPDGCPHCGFHLVTSDDYEECEWCGWAEDQEPKRTPEEAREKFLEDATHGLFG